MTADELVPFFAPRGLWLLYLSPIPDDPSAALRHVVTVPVDGEAVVLGFSTQERAEACRLVQGVVLEASTLSDPRAFGPFLDGLVVIGYRTLWLNPGDADEARMPLRDFANALHRHLFGHRFGSGGVHPN